MTKYSRVDGGYGWVIVFSSFIMHFVLIGQTRTFGVLYVALLRLFGKSAAETATLSACFNTIRMLLAPVVSILCKKSSCRVSMMCGGVVMLLGFTISAFARSLNSLYISYGVIAGSGAALVFTPAYIIVAQYFDKKKGKAMSLGTIGAGIGSVVFAPVTVFLLHTYTFSGCMLILGAISFNICLAGALLRPFKEKPVILELIVGVNSAKGNICSETPAAVVDGQESLEPNTEMKSVENGNTVLDSKLQAQHPHVVYQCSDETKQKQTEAEKAQEVSNKPSLSSILLSTGKGIKSFIRLFKNTTMILYCASIFVMPIGMGMVIFFVSDAAVLIGASDADAALLLSIFGGCDALSRLAWGFVFDLKMFRSRRRMLFSAIGIVMGVQVAAVGLMQSYLGYAVMCALFGLVSSGYHSQRVTVVSEFVTKQRLPDIVGVSIFFQGLGVLVGLPFGGYMKDVRGNYDFAYCVSGLAVTVTSGLFLLDYVIKHSKRHNTSRRSENSGFDER